MVSSKDQGLEGSLPCEDNIRLLKFRYNDSPGTRRLAQVTSNPKKMDTSANISETICTAGNDKWKLAPQYNWRLANLPLAYKASFWPPADNHSQVCFDAMPPAALRQRSPAVGNQRRPSFKIDEEAEERKASKACSGQKVPEDEPSKAGHKSGLLIDMESSLARGVEGQLKDFDNGTEHPNTEDGALEPSKKLERLPCKYVDESLRSALEAVKVASLYARIAKQAETFRKRSNVMAK